MTIPITFTVDGRTYTGHFSRVSGSASTATFHLTINGFHYGRLRLREHDLQWFFDSNDGMFGEMAEWFGSYVTAYFEGLP
jgi:hypothetical protein